ncbi:BTB/POZ domain-containing protein At1g63850-like [Aristolochia californica]|uniref:BTB/POZ domain-containing protein At1g63850-like n=1 Tax=Aristolochia californica TaxID=171875 RepID=UPI0035DC4618
MAATAHLKTQTLHKPKRRKRRETTISATAAPDAETPQRKPPVVASDGAWCCTARFSPPPPAPPPPPPPPSSKRRSTPPPGDQEDAGTVCAFSRSPSPVRVASPVVMDSPAGYAPYPACYTKFNTALNAGLLNPMSPPPVLDKTRSSPTLFEMMANEQDCHPRQPIPVGHPPLPNGKSVVSVQDRQLQLQERTAEILGSCSPGNQFNDASSSDVRLTLSSKDGLSIAINVHRQILVAHSRFFAAKLSDRWSKQQRSLPHIVEISDCDDVEIYMETLRLMYCKDLRRKLMKEDVSKVLGILKVSAAIVFDAGVLSCLEYLEAAPWAEDEEEKVASVLAQLHLEGAGAGEVLKRVSIEVPVTEEGNQEEILLRLLQVVLEGKDEKARRDMKGLVSKMLRENSSHNDISKESLYSACDSCLQLLRSHLLAAADGTGPFDIGQISRQAGNLHWILDILIDRQIGEEFSKTWAGEGEVAAAHSRVPLMHRYEVSRVTARLFVGMGKGQVLVSKEVRCLLLRTWLGPFYDDFGWMRRACKGLDRHLVEDGLSNTILTLPLSWQQEFLLAWFDRFLNSGEDCPNIQRAFEVWWRRAFWKRNGEPDRLRQLRIGAACENS